MTRLAPLWQQASTYPANTDRVLLATLWPTAGSTGGAATTVTNTMNVSVAAGTAAVPLGTAGSNYSALCRWDAAEVVTLTAAPPAGQSRIDLVVAQVRDNTLDAGGNNDFIFQAVAGTPTTGTPAAPAVPSNAYPICQLTVPGGAANLNGVTVVDRRAPLVPAGAFGNIGYAQITANQTGIVGTAVDLAGLAVTVTVAAGRRVRITGSCPNIGSTVAGDAFGLLIMEGATQLQLSITTLPVAAQASNCAAVAVVQPAAGPHTYKLQGWRTNGTGTVTVNAGPTYPTFILVEDIGT